MASLLLASLGSLSDESAAQPVLELSFSLAALGLTVRPGFWQEEPTLVQALRDCGPDVHILPVLAAEDYFSRTLVPRELGASANGRRLNFHRPLGARAAFIKLLATRVIGAAEGQIGRAVLAPTSDRASQRVAGGLLSRLGAALPGGAILAQSNHEPTPGDVWVPIQLRGGWFGEASDAPLPPGVLTCEAPWRGSEILGCVLSLSEEFANGSTAAPIQDPWTSILNQLKAGRVGMGEALLTPLAPGLVEIRSALDAGRSDLEVLVTLAGLSARARRHPDGRFRPVRGLRGLQRGWRAVLSESESRLAVATLTQPGALADSAADEAAVLASTSWEVTARRQSGLDARVRHANNKDLEAVAQELCVNCLKTRLWAGMPLAGSILSGQPGQIPCAEPCPLFIRGVRDRLPAHATRGESPDEAGA